MTRYRFLMLAAALTGAMSCEEFTPPPIRPEPPPPPAAPQPFTVQLTTPNLDDGAIILEIRGRYTDTPRRANAAMWLLAEAMDSAVVRIVVVADLGSGPLLSLDVPEGATPASYQVTILEVTNRAGTVRPSLDGYSLTITR